jgi:hypothetical protein
MSFRRRGKQRCEVAEVNHDVGSDDQIEACRQTVEPSHALAAVEPIIDASDDDPTTRIRRLSSPSSKNEYAGNRTQTICAGPAASCGIGNEC